MRRVAEPKLSVRETKLIINQLDNKTLTIPKKFANISNHLGLRAASDELMKDLALEHSTEVWSNCRLLDKREGYVCAGDNGEYLLESRANMKSMLEME